MGRTSHLSSWRKFCHGDCYADRDNICYRDTHKYGCPHCNPNEYADGDSTSCSYVDSHADRYLYAHRNPYRYTNNVGQANRIFSFPFQPRAWSMWPGPFSTLNLSHYVT